MKKIIAMLLALVMICSLATVAFADTVDTTGWTAPERKDAINLVKVYTVTGSTDSTLFPTETLKFSVAVPTGVTNPTDDMITVDDLVVAGNADQKIIINLPEYDTVGIYEYVITEKEGTAQAVGYTTASIALKVLVEYDYEKTCLKSTIVLATTTEDTNDADGKVDTFTNTYDVGHLTVQKTISGNLASSDVFFAIDVTLTSAETVESAITISGGSGTGENANPTTIAETDWSAATGEGASGYTVTKTIYLRANETLTFNNIPAGVTYSVVEQAKHGVGNDGFDPNSAADTDYTITYEKAADTIAPNETDAAVVKNEKKTNVETGVILDSAPYFVMLAVALFGMVALVAKKRYEV